MNRAPNKRAAEGAKTADDDANQKAERKGQAEALRRNEADRDCAQTPGDARIERAHAEAGGLVQRRIDPHRFGGDRLIAKGDERTPDPPAHQVARGPVERGG